MMITDDDIETPRLALRLLGREASTACLNKHLGVAARCIGASIPDELAEHLSGLRSDSDRLVENPNFLPWSTRAIVLREEKTMIGLIRFHTCPDPPYLLTYGANIVEIGYRVFCQYRRQGYATEAATHMMRWAQKTCAVVNFIASVSPTNLASIGMLRRLGFTKVGEELDERDGLEYVFLRAEPQT